MSLAERSLEIARQRVNRLLNQDSYIQEEFEEAIQYLEDASWNLGYITGYHEAKNLDHGGHGP